MSLQMTSQCMANACIAAEVRLSQDAKVGEACRHLGVSEQSFYRWRQEYGGIEVSQAHRLKELERENARLKKVVADLTLPDGEREDGALFGLMSIAQGAIRERQNRWRAPIVLEELI